MMTTRIHHLVAAIAGLLVTAQAGDQTSGPSEPVRPVPLLLPEVVQSVKEVYPPLLAALVERDIAAGRLQSTMGSFDFNWFAKAFGTPAGFYDSGTVEIGFEQFLGLWGSTLFGGYRLTDGDVLPDYRKDRTQGGGEVTLGVNLPLLRNGRIDKRRAAVMKARFDAELVDPLIQRQQIDFVRAASAAYFGWLSAGEKLRISQELLDLARDRISVLETQVEKGLIKKLVITDNRRLVVDREIQLTNARRDFDGSALALSLFYRGADMDPMVPGADRLPSSFPSVSDLSGVNVGEDVRVALERRPELRKLELELSKAGVDIEQARNEMQPFLNASVFGAQNLGEDIYKDLTEFEVGAALEFRMPLQRREARGNTISAESKQQQLLYDLRFANERIAAEIRNTHLALVAAYEQIAMARVNVALAEELEGAEKELFARGASDFLAVQLREQAAFSARVKVVEALEAFFVSLANYDAVTMRLQIQETQLDSPRAEYSN